MEKAQTLHMAKGAFKHHYFGPSRPPPHFTILTFRLNPHPTHQSSNINLRCMASNILIKDQMTNNSSFNGESFTQRSTTVSIRKPQRSFINQLCIHCASANFFLFWIQCATLLMLPYCGWCQNTFEMTSQHHSNLFEFHIHCASWLIYLGF